VKKSLGLMRELFRFPLEKAERTLRNAETQEACLEKGSTEYPFNNHLDQNVGQSKRGKRGYKGKKCKKAVWEERELPAGRNVHQQKGGGTLSNWMNLDKRGGGKHIKGRRKNPDRKKP